MRSRLMLTVATLLASLLIALPALAQGWRQFENGDNLFDPAVSTKQMERYAEILGFTADQQAAALALLEAYHVEFDAAARPVRDRIEELRNEARETRDRALWGEIMQARGDFEQQAEKMADSFLADVQTLLTPQQAQEGWPKVQRERRRELSIPRGLMSGERVDVIALVDALSLDEAQRAQLDDTLNQYALELDQALVKRDEVQDDFRQNMRDMFREGDQEGINDMFERGKQAATRVRDINNRYARQIEALLPEDAAPTFAAQVRQRAFPMIYNPSRAERLLETASKFDDLSQEQKEQIGTIRASFGQSLTSINRQMETAQVEMEESMTADRMGQMFRNGGENDAMRDLRRQKRDLERSTVEKLRTILTEQQAERLPQRGEGEGQGDGRRRFGGPRGEPEGARDGESGERRGLQGRRNRDGDS